MTLPSYLQQYQAPDVGAALSANLGSAMPPHVSIAGNKFTLIDAANNELQGAWFDQAIGVYIDACIVDVNNVKSRVYFAGAFDSSAEGVRPDCFSDNGTGPSISANSPQGATCQPDPERKGYGCFWSVWGSKINQNGKKVPACSEKQKMALLIPGYNTLFLLAVPPNSHGPLREYTEHCKAHGVNMANLMTRIWFAPGEVGTLLFRGLSYIDEPTAKLRQAAYVEKKTDALVGRNDVARTAGAIGGQAGQISPPVQTQQGQPQIPFAQTATPAAPTGTGVGFATQPATSVANWPVQTQQVQQPGPFTQPGTTSASGAATSQPSSNAAAPSAGNPAQQAEQPAGQRRRRRTAAEMAQANGAAPAGQPAQQTAAPQAPFPHAGQTTMSPTTAAPAGTFGIAEGQPAAANPELAGMLDDFFKQG
jgi:hypothetical protein